MLRSVFWTALLTLSTGIYCSVAADDQANTTLVANLLSPTAGIQEAIDALGGKAGVVTIPAGTYVLHRSVRVHSNLTLQGAGEQTVLTRPKQAGSKLAAPAGAEDRSLQVENTAGLAASDEIGIFDQTHRRLAALPRHHQSH